MSEIRYPFRVRKVVQVPVDRVPGYIYMFTYPVDLFYLRRYNVKITWTMKKFIKF